MDRCVSSRAGSASYAAATMSTCRYTTIHWVIVELQKGAQVDAKSARPQELSKSKLVFISMNVNYEYSGKFDWGRKPRAPAPVQHVLHAPPAGSRRRAPATGLFFLGVAGCWTPRKNSPEVSRRCEDPARGACSLSSSSSYGDPARTDKSLLSSTYK